MIGKSPQTFEDFMRRALYDPERGYYARRIMAVGKRGDFTTAPMLSDSLARAIAIWAARALRESGCRDLIEIGPGEGVLAESVRKHLPWILRRRTRLHLVETSKPLAEHQQLRLGRKAVWHESPADALAACDGRAVIFSNELVDAFPVRRFQWTSAGWKELAVSFDAQGNATESLIPPASLPDSSSFSAPHSMGQRVESHQSYRSWLTNWVPLWRAGHMLTIDYGATAEKLYHRRPHGTVRGYLLQQRVEGEEIYQNIGFQDLTADVNFTDIMNWSAPWMKSQQLQTLGGFLNSCGVVDHGLADQEGAGTAFLVLEQQRAEF